MKIKAGTGITVDACDFMRVVADTPIEVDTKRSHGGYVVGYIAGDMAHPCGFMRRQRVMVTTQRRFLIED